MNKLPFTIVETKAPEPIGPGRFRTFVAYAAVAVGVAVATFVVTPVYAQGSMAPSVRVVVAKPSASILMLGQRAEMERDREFRVREQIKQNHRLELETARAANRRALEADRAYYKKLADQRKKRGK